MNNYRKLPVEVQAVQFGGSSTQMGAIKSWIAGNEYRAPHLVTADLRSFTIDTLEGAMTVSPGDWVVKGVEGEFYPVKPEIFAKTYEVAR